MRVRRSVSTVLGLAAFAFTIAGHGADPTPVAATAQSAAPETIASRGGPDLQLPGFQPGLWEYRRTQISSAGGKPQSATIRRCSDPSAEFKRKLAELKQRGCIFTPLKRNGRHYEASWRCPAADGTVLAMRDIITVNSDTSYLNESEAVVSRQATRSTIVAIRQGDCPGAARPGSPGQATPKQPVR
jgi:hypothetical protein